MPSQEFEFTPIIDLRNLLPHQPPFLFLDEICSFSLESRTIVAARRVPTVEPWTHAHFPEASIVPGVLLVEGMAQTSGALARLLRASDDHATRRGYLVAINRARFVKPVFPGDQIRFHSSFKGEVTGLSLFDARVERDGVRVATAEITLGLG